MTERSSEISLHQYAYEPDALGPDGVTRIQRAILRCVCRDYGHVSCLKVINALLDDASCPKKVLPWQIYADLLILSAPEASNCTLLDYYGAVCDTQGWLPGPIFRTVQARMGLRGLLPNIDDAGPIWSDRPLPIRFPLVASTGAASWRIETEGPWTRKGGYNAARMCCTAVHLLRCDAKRILALQRAVEAGVEVDGPPFLRLGGNCVFLGVNDPYKLGATYDVLSNARGGSCFLPIAAGRMLPHGHFIAMEGTPSARGGADGLSVVSVPRLFARFVCDEGRLSLSLRVCQPACGRHLGHEGDIHEALQRSIELTEYDPGAWLDEIRLLVPTECASAVVHRVPFVPLSDAIVDRLLRSLRL